MTEKVWVCYYCMHKNTCSRKSCTKCKRPDLLDFERDRIFLEDEEDQEGITFF